MLSFVDNIMYKHIKLIYLVSHQLLRLRYGNLFMYIVCKQMYVPLRPVNFFSYFEYLYVSWHYLDVT